MLFPNIFFKILIISLSPYILLSLIFILTDIILHALCSLEMDIHLLRTVIDVRALQMKAYSNFGEESGTEGLPQS